MRVWIVLFLLVTQSATYAVTVLSNGARNVKHGAPYGGASAVGDGVHDDTQAFLDALNINLDGTGTGVSPVYVPPGNYIVSKQLIFWVPGFIFGEPSDPPTIILKSGSMMSGAQPFIATLGSYGHRPYDSNWNSAGQPGGSHGNYATTNNTFFLEIRDINFTVQQGNPGCSDVFLWQVAQQTSLRNSVMKHEDAAGNVFRQDNNGGGGVIQNMTCTGGAKAAVIQQTSQMMYRGCTFNGEVDWNGYWIINFLACIFNNPGGFGFVGGGGRYAGLSNCTFTANTDFRCSSPYHLDHAAGKTRFSSSNVYYNRTSESGASPKLDAISSPFVNPPLPHPSSACVNVKTTYGAKGDGSTDDTAPIQRAFAFNMEVYFPSGTYLISKTITLTAGHKAFGSGTAFTRIQCNGGTSFGPRSTSPIFALSGRGSDGVVLANMYLAQNAIGRCVTSNADQTSQIVDVYLGSTNTSSPAVAYFRTGGGMYENGWCPNDGNTTALLISSSDPLYLYAVAPEHYDGPTIVVSGAQNVYFKNLQFEFLHNQSPSQTSIISGSTNINIDGTIGGGHSFPNLFTISGSTVNLFGVAISGNSAGVVREGSSFYGPMGSGINLLPGYVNINPTPNPTPTPSAPHQERSRVRSKRPARTGS
jgi:hypothetical protein